VTPSDSQPLGSAGEELSAGNVTRAIELLEEAEREAPLDRAIQYMLRVAYEHAGDAVRAAAAGVAAEALEKNEPLLLYNLATGYFLHGHSKLAEKWYRATLLLDPNLAMAHENLAAILTDSGRPDEAAEHLERAYRQQWIFVEPATLPRASVLLTCAAGLGNVPIRDLLPIERFTRVKCIVEYAKADELANLPDHQVVFNVIGDADCRAANHPDLRAVLHASGKPVINDPTAVAHTRRDRLPGLLEGIEGVVVPAVFRLDSMPATDAQLAATLAESAAKFPVILRPAKAHGGQGVALVNRPEDAASWFRSTRFPDERGAVYVTAFHQNRAADGYFRKYRVLYVDGRAYPYHLAISRHWLVHYFSAEMGSEPWKLAEERHFLEEPQNALGTPVWRAVEDIGRALDLDYAGIDFTITPRGSLLVFEANATMLVHLEQGDGVFAYKNVHVHKILDAFQAMVVKRAVR
jgi:glutathione synthase/RimK-type ligase-like ATP-grasp enzyme/Tfp pilus assembly protein PilF